MRLVLVHGFTQSPASWDGVRRHIPDHLGGEPVEVVTPEVPDGLDFASTARAVVEMGGWGTYCGYSMGGRLCLRAALDRPDLVRGAVLVSASPGIADDAARAERAHLDDELAERVGRLGVPAFLRQWLAQPLFSTLEADEDEIAGRAAQTSVKRLEHQLRVLGQGSQLSMWKDLPSLVMPVTIVTGRGDLKYESIGDDMAAALASGVRVHVDGGHALPLEHPEAVARAITATMQRVLAHGSTP